LVFIIILKWKVSNELCHCCTEAANCLESEPFSFFTWGLGIFRVNF
jgi:hypothetical protein